MTVCITANSISWIAKGPTLHELFGRENREKGLISQSCSKVRFPTNIEPTYSLLRVPTQGTACKRKKRKKRKNTQISRHQCKVPVWKNNTQKIKVTNVFKSFMKNSKVLKQELNEQYGRKTYDCPMFLFHSCQENLKKQKEGLLQSLLILRLDFWKEPKNKKKFAPMFEQCQYLVLSILGSRTTSPRNIFQVKLFLMKVIRNYDHNYHYSRLAVYITKFYISQEKCVL